ncbi:hypothetical protein FH972_021058 [Carpinus fangiana]|uniref:DNA 3'-5' helicase n=1 Tax=Carpinus fangiana TaxID=176857 RepID=A0A5N6KNT5_9ROSI|nr:hypothetical protein FH972_021058 [Carpinus fangiana]
MDSVASMLEGLNAAQKAAVTSQSSVVQVLAPPGSGKTKTLTARVAYLISHLGMHPGNIIVCTFTVKAAREMRERLTALLGSETVNKLLLGTFHSISRRFLVTYGRHIQLNEKFGIADTSDSKSIVTRIIKRLGLTIDPKTARNRISTFKSKGTTAEQYAEETASKVQKRANAETVLRNQEIVAVYSGYEEHLRVSNLLDYDDLLVKCRELLRSHPSCVDHIQAVLIDEFQDTNHIQFDLMRRFSSARKVVTTVGDPDQSIYGWRSADVTNLKKMKENFPDLHVVNLEENYRSSGAILLAAQEIIEQDQSRPAKSLMPTHALGLSPVLRKLPRASKEAQWIVCELKRTIALTAGLLNWDDYAILLRSAALSRLIEKELGNHGIPYRMVGGHRFFDRYEVRLLLDYLRVIDLPGHTDALARVLNTPARQIGDGTMKVLLDEAASRQVSLWVIVRGIAQDSIKLTPKPKRSEDGKTKMVEQISKQAKRGLETFFNIIHTSRVKLDETSDDSLVQFIEWVVKKIGLLKHLKEKCTEEEELQGRWANVEELIANAEEAVTKEYEDERIPSHEEQDPPEPVDGSVPRSRVETLRKFLGNVALSTEAEQKEDGASTGHVTISTIHAAKGLEWPFVFIPAVYDGSIPHSRAEDNDEERRLLYVAMTRAQAMLYLSYPDKNSQQGATTLSHFLSSRNITQHFSIAGPTVKTEDVHEMSLILRRECPNVKSIAAAQERTRPREDKKFLKYSYNGEDMEYTDDDSEAESKKRKWNSTEGFVPPGKRTQMKGFDTVKALMDQGELSTANTTLPTSFTSAKTLARSADLPPLSVPHGAREIAPVRTMLQASSSSTSKPASQQQSSIMGYFGKKADTTAASTSNLVLQPLSHNSLCPHPGREMTEASASPASSFASFKHADDPSCPKQPAPAAIGLSRNALAATHGPGFKPPTIANHSTRLPLDTSEANQMAESRVTKLKPARTLHSLTTTTTPLGYPMNAVGRSYGAKMSMNGWQNRTHK